MRCDQQPTYCQGCGTELPTRTYGNGGTPRGNPQKWCGAACRARTTRAAQREPIPSRNCGYCGQEFTPKRRRTAKFCGVECARKARLVESTGRQIAEPTERDCPMCERTFLPAANNARSAVMCSPECYNTARRHRIRVDAAGAVYREHVWPQRVFERDNWTCGICHGPIDSTLTGHDRLGPSVDHIIGLGDGGEHSYANTQAAHMACNAGKRSEARRLGKLAAIARQRGLTLSDYLAGVHAR